MVQHLFKECHFAKLIWWASPLAISTYSNPSVLWIQWISNWTLLLHLHRTSDHIGINIIAGVVWSIWCFRNKVLFDTILRNSSKLVNILQHNLRTLISLREHDLEDRWTILTPTQSIQRTHTMTWGHDQLGPRIIIHIASTWLKR